MMKRAFLPLAVFSAALLPISACKSQNEAPPASIAPRKVVKAWWPAWDTFQIGARRAEGATTRTTFLQKADYSSALQAFKAGEVDAATLTIYEAIEAIDSGLPIKIALLLDYTMGSDGVVAKRALKSIKDLKGKRVGTEVGTVAHFTLLKSLEKAGLEASEVTITNYTLEELQKAFIEGKVDAIGIYEPYMSKMVKEGDGHIVFSSREIPRAICDVLFVHERVVRESPETIQHWISAWSAALAQRREKPEQHLALLSQLNGTPIADNRTALEGIFLTDVRENRMAFGTADRPGYLLEALQQMHDFMLEQGVIKKRLSLKAALYFEGIQRFPQQ